MIREIVGVREDTIDVADGARLETILDGYSGRFPRLRDMLPSIVIALNQQFANPARPVSEGDEVAFLPPVSGGSGSFTHSIAHDDGHFFALTRDPIDGAAIARKIAARRRWSFRQFRRRHPQ